MNRVVAIAPAPQAAAKAAQATPMVERNPRRLTSAGTAPGGGGAGVLGAAAEAAGFGAAGSAGALSSVIARPYS